MKKIPTVELLDSFFSEADSAYKRRRKIIKEEQLFDYEKKIGKEFVDMSADEITEFLSEINPRRNSAKSYNIQKDNTINQIRTIYKRIFDYYIDSYDNTLKNPFDDVRIIPKSKDCLSYNTIDDIIKKHHKDFPPDRADYYELIILLYYNGFENATEIVEMKEADINNKNKTVKIKGRTIKLSDRCYSLLEKFHEMTELEGWRNFDLTSWHGSYFKFIVQHKNTQNVDERTLKKMRESINVMICKYINNRYNLNISYSDLYYLGFYDFLVDSYGKEKTDEMINSNYNHEFVKSLENSAKEYQLKYNNVSQLKRKMRMFVEVN